MLRKKGIVLIMMGGVLMLSALLLFLYNRYEDEKSGIEAAQALTEVKEAIREPEEETEREAVSENKLNPEMTVREIGGYEYIGYILVPSVEIELPVMAEWDYTRLKLAPCRYFGSTKTDDLVIAGHNTNGHFSRLKKLETGAEVVFTDMDDEEIVYVVEKIEVVYPDEVDKVINSDYDLVLYTCTYSAKARHTVFCSRVEDTDKTQQDERSGEEEEKK